MLLGNKRALLVLVAFGLFILFNQRNLESGAELKGAATVEKIDGTDISRVTLTPKAAERLDVQTTPLREAIVVLEADGEEIEIKDYEDTPPSSNHKSTSKNEMKRKIVPYSAVLYDVDGGAWVYQTTEPLAFVRHAVKIDFIDDDLAFLTEGPPVGTKIVTRGVAELYGAEKGIGK